MQIELKPSGKKKKFDSEGKFHGDMKVLQLGKTVFDVESDVQSNVSFRSRGAAEVGWRSNHCATSPLTDLAGEAPLHGTDALTWKAGE